MVGTPQLFIYLCSRTQEAKIFWSGNANHYVYNIRAALERITERSWPQDWLMHNRNDCVATNCSPVPCCQYASSSHKLDMLFSSPDVPTHTLGISRVLFRKATIRHSPGEKKLFRSTMGLIKNFFVLSWSSNFALVNLWNILFVKNPISSLDATNVCSS